MFGSLHNSHRFRKIALGKPMSTVAWMSSGNDMENSGGTSFGVITNMYATRPWPLRKVILSRHYLSSLFWRGGGTAGGGTLTHPFKGGKLFYLQLELFCLQLSFFAYSPLSLKVHIRRTFPL